MKNQGVKTLPTYMISLLIVFTVFTNTLRTQNGVPTLVPSIQLSQIAQDRAQYLCTHAFSHEGFQMFFIARRYYPTPFQGENLATTFSSDYALESAWENSPEHRANLLDMRFTEIGIGRACGITVEEFD